MSDRRPDVIVVGAGVAGCGIAWRLAQRGLRVLILERDEPGRGASWAAAGMLTPVGETSHDDAFAALGEEALRRWESFAQELTAIGAGTVGLRRSGRMQIATNAAAAERLRRLASSPAGKRAQAVWLDPAAARSLEPALTSDIVGAVIFPGDASADPRALAQTLAHAAVDAGAFLRKAEVKSIRRDADGVCGVQLRDGSVVSARCIVLAAGAWASQVDGLPTPLPVRPIRGEMFAVRVTGFEVQHIVWGEGCYVVPRSDGRVLVGATVDDVGFAPGPTPAGLAALSHAAERILPKLSTQQVLEAWAGYRPGTPDALPILGPDERLPGLFHASGLYRNGILLAPLVADEVAAAVSRQDAAFDLSPFRPTRAALG